MTILETHELTKTYRSKAVVNAVSLKVDAGQIHGFLGPNGSGKTTTLGMILGVLHPSRGSIRLFGAEQGEALQQARRRIGAFLEQPNFVPYLSAKDNLALIANIKSQPGKNISAKDIAQLIELVGLTDAGKREFKFFSLGMKQRLALASALMGGPDLLVLDEPTNGLDPEGIQEIRELILTLAGRGLTILLSSHLLAEVEKVCTHISIIRQGKLLCTDSLANLTNHNPRYKLVATNPGAVQTALADCAVVASIENTGSHLLVTLVRDEPEQISRHLARHELFLSGLIPEAAELEKEYFRLMEAQRDGETVGIASATTSATTSSTKGDAQ